MDLRPCRDTRRVRRMAAYSATSSFFIVESRELAWRNRLAVADLAVQSACKDIGYS